MIDAITCLFATAPAISAAPPIPAATVAAFVAIISPSFVPISACDIADNAYRPPLTRETAEVIAAISPPNIDKIPVVAESPIVTAENF